MGRSKSEIEPASTNCSTAVKVKAVPLQAWNGPEDFRKLKIPRFHENGTGWR